VTHCLKHNVEHKSPTNTTHALPTAHKALTEAPSGPQTDTDESGTSLVTLLPTVCRQPAEIRGTQPCGGIKSR